MSDGTDPDFYNSMGSRYEAAFGHDPGLRAFVQRALDLLPVNSSVFEAGSGTGRPTSQMIVENGHRLHAIDFSTTMVALGHKQVPTGHFEHANILDYKPQPEPRFDAIFAMFSLFFSREEMSMVLTRWASWMLPGGYVFIGVMLAEDYSTTPDMYEDDGMCAHDIKIMFMGRKLHSLLFSKEGWNKMLSDSGFEVLFTERSDFQAPTDAQSDMEPHYYIAARRVAR